jgi:hypothetical protein
MPIYVSKLFYCVAITQKVRTLRVNTLLWLRVSVSFLGEVIGYEWLQELAVYSLVCDFRANRHCQLFTKNNGHYCEPISRLQKVIGGKSFESY